MPDEDDRAFFDTATAAKGVLVTGNKRHYPNEEGVMSLTEYFAARE
jgi:hypothetical protein